MHPFTKQVNDQLSLTPGEIIKIQKKLDSNWWIGMNSAGVVGIFPCKFINELQTHGNDKTYHSASQLPSFQPAGSRPGNIALSSSSGNHPTGEYGKLTSSTGNLPVFPSSAAPISPNQLRSSSGSLVTV